MYLLPSNILANSQQLRLPVTQKLCNTRFSYLSSGPHITRFSAAVAKKQKNFQ